jgi:hypothetical protein
MNARMALVLFALVSTGAACARGLPSGPQQLTATSNTYTVSGEYAHVPLDRIDALTIENGRLALKGVLKGSPADVVKELPAAADPERRARRWALVTDAHVNGRRVVTFTEAESVTDVTIELPDGEAPLRFIVFGARDQGEVVVFATGDVATGPPSLYGQFTIR